MTSNLGSNFLIDPLLDDKQKKESVLGVVRATFKPEFLNRLDDLVLFDALTREQLADIVSIQLDLLSKRLEDRQITLDITQEAKDWLVAHGYDPLYGARPLRRLIQTAIGDQLAKQILNNTIKNGQTITVSTSPDKTNITLIG
jgi:ATP-dependent Clp protease ATP-binding subunit ClpB